MTTIWMIMGMNKSVNRRKEVKEWIDRQRKAIHSNSVMKTPYERQMNKWIIVIDDKDKDDYGCENKCEYI